MLTFMGYRFELEWDQDGVRSHIVALDPDTPQDVMELLVKTMAMNQLCYLKRFTPQTTDPKSCE